MGSLVSRAIYDEELGQKFSSTREWLCRLIDRDGGINSSFGFENYVNRSLLHGFDAWKEMEGFKGYIETLKEREEKGDVDASHCISKGIYDEKRFTRLFPIFRDPSPQERYAELMTRAKKGSWSARDYVCRAHGEGNFGQKRTQRSRTIFTEVLCYWIFF